MRLSWKEIRTCAAKFTDEWWTKGKSTGGFWIVVWVVFVLVAAVWFSIKFWCWLGAGESGSTTIRNIALVIAALIGLPIAIWRSMVAERQATASQSQAEIAERGLLNERYQKGAEMLGSDVLSVRLGGIYALRQLAEEHPKDYHLQIMRLFCAFVCHPPKEEDKTQGVSQPAREDVRAVMEVIGTSNKVQIDIEQQENYVPNLCGADLRNQYLYEMNLSRVQLTRARLSGAFLARAILSGVECFETDLSGAKLPGANLAGASLRSANLSSVEAAGADFSNASLYSANLTDADLSGAVLNGVDFTGANLAGAIFYKDGVLAEGLTQRRITFATAIPEDRPPRLDGLIDPETDKRIEWNKRPRVIK